MENQQPQDKSQCQTHCEDKFTACTARHPSGCVEGLRLCRERCNKK